MNILEMANAIKTISNYDKATFAIFKGLKEQKEVILELNKQQLFEDSIGADGKALGFYSFSDENKILGRDGTPFTMVDTGLFKKGMYIEFYYKTITIRSMYHVYDMLQNKNFRTYEFFGLTEDNYELLVEDYVQPILLTWMREVISGKNPNTESAQGL